MGSPSKITGAGATVTEDGVKITAGGVYTVSGTLADGMIEVDAANQDVEVVLAGASITNSDGPAIYFAAASDKAKVTLQRGTKNSLKDGGSSDQDAALYAAMTLTVGGEGALDVDATYEGISSTMHLTFAGGEIRIRAVEDGINANNDNISIITVTGGYLYVESETGDAIDSNGTIVISGGKVVALGAPDRDASNGLDADVGITLTGGTVVATGQQGFRLASTSTVEAVYVNFGTVQPAGTLVAILRGQDPLLVFAPQVRFPVLTFASAEIADNVNYTVMKGGTATGSAVDGLYANDSYSGGTTVSTVTTASMNTVTGPGGGMRPPR